MKKRQFLMYGIIILFSSFLLLGDKVAANLELFMDQFQKVKIEVNGEMMEEDSVPPFIVNNRTVVPLNQAVEMLNAYTEWDDGRKIVTIHKPLVNMTIITRSNKNAIEVNPTFKAGSTHSFKVATQVSRVPISQSLKTRFIVVDSEGSQIFSSSFTIDTEKVDGSFMGNLDVANLSLKNKGEYVLKLQIEDPDNEERYLTIGECIMVAK